MSKQESSFEADRPRAFIVAIILSIFALAFVLHSLYRRSKDRETAIKWPESRETTIKWPESRETAITPAQSVETLYAGETKEPVEHEQAVCLAMQEVEPDYQRGNIEDADYYTPRERHTPHALTGLKSRYEREQNHDMDQSPNQLQEDSQEDSKILLPEISADIAHKKILLESQKSNLETKSTAEDKGRFIHPLLRRFLVLSALSWRFPRRRQGELRYILMTVLAVAVLTGLAFTAYMGYIGVKSPTETYFFTEKAHQKIVIKNEQGSITIHSQPHGPFGFRIERYSKGFGPGLLGMDATYTQYAATINLITHVPPDILFSGTRGINIDVTVPASDTTVQAYTGEGSIVLKGLTGDIEAKTDKGALTVENGQGQARLSAKMGSISVSQFSGQLAMTTHQGDIKASDVHLSGQSSMLAESGAITLNGSLDRYGNYHLNTDTGSISLSLPETAAFQLAFNHNFGFFVNEFGSQEHGQAPQAKITVSTEYGTFALYKAR